MRRRAWQRARDQAQRLGEEIRSARVALGFTTDAAAMRARISRSTWRRVEEGAPEATLATVCAVAASVGLDATVRTYPGAGPSLRDRGQLAIAQRLAALAHPRWGRRLEVAAGDHGQAADLVFDAADEVVVVEVIRHLSDFQAQYRSITRKRDWLDQQYAKSVRLVLALEDLRSNRNALAPFAETITTTFPAGSRAVLGALRHGRPVGADGLLWVRRPRTAR